MISELIAKLNRSIDGNNIYGIREVMCTLENSVPFALYSCWKREYMRRKSIASELYAAEYILKQLSANSDRLQ